uniref:Uncharacterized protein n=1 Tax=Sinocyclocheilus rhinocerous TaxID=307959 RepID=A0A673G9L7_9TELE
MAAQCEPLSGYLQQSDPGSNSERSADSPLPVSEDDSSGPTAPPDPEWTEERFRVDRKKLEIMLLASADPVMFLFSFVHLLCDSRFHANFFYIFF